MARGFTKAQVEELRRLYCHSKASLSAIATKFGVSINTVRRQIQLQGWPLRRAVIKQTGKSLSGKDYLNRKGEAPNVSRKLASKCRGLAQCTERPELVGRVWAAALSQINDLEKRTTSLGRKNLLRASDDARAIAILVRTLKDLITLDSTLDGGAREKAKQSAAEQIGGRKGWSSLAEDLARRLAGLRKRRTSAEPSFGDGG